MIGRADTVTLPSDVLMVDQTRSWVHDAIQRLRVDANRTADTHVHRFPLPPSWGIHLYLKDESSQPTGSLKHRLAHSLVLDALVSGRIGPQTTLVDASSGSTAIAEAYFARVLGLEFVAVVPAATSPEKLRLIERAGGRCHLIDDGARIAQAAAELAAEIGGCFLDQFGRAAVATDWRRDNLASSLFDQLALEPHAEPAWVVVGVGTGGTSAVIGRYARLRGYTTRVAVADPDGSALFDAWRTGEDMVAAGGIVEGIGRPRVEASFNPALVDTVFSVPDAYTFAAVDLLERRTGLRAGASTGTNLVAALQLVAEMRERGESGSVATLVCDGADRYAETTGDPAWLTARGIQTGAATAALEDFLARGGPFRPARDGREERTC